MILKIKYKNDSYEIITEGDNPVIILKTQIFSLTGLLPNQQYFVDKSNYHDNTLVSDLGLTDGDTLVISDKPPEKPVVPEQAQPTLSSSPFPPQSSTGPSQNALLNQFFSSPTPQSTSLTPKYGAVFKSTPPDFSNLHPLLKPMKTNLFWEEADANFKKYSKLNAQAVTEIMNQKVRPLYSRFRQFASIPTHFLSLQQYESPIALRKSLSLIPFERILKETSEDSSNPKKHQDSLFKSLMNWFNKDFFTFTKKPKCMWCGKNDQITPRGRQPPHPSMAPGAVGVVEIYTCNSCKKITQFPRLNSALMLLEENNRRGRCGEWVIAFHLVCRAFGFQVRTVVDFTDHVWLEVWSRDLNRWVHADPCENVWDSPLMYETGWGKKLNWVFAIAYGEVVDVTKRYTRDFSSVLSRRAGVPELSTALLISTLNRWAAQRYTLRTRVLTPLNLILSDKGEDNSYFSIDPVLRRITERKNMHKSCFIQSKVALKADEMVPRKSGALVPST